MNIINTGSTTHPPPATTTPSTSTTTCAAEYPFAYLNGDYCCKTNQELWYGGNPAEIASGTCDGTGFSKESTCCNGHDYQKCPHPTGCYDFNETTPATTTATTITIPSTNTTGTSTATTSSTTTEDPIDIYNELVEMAYDTLQGRKLTKGK